MTVSSAASLLEHPAFRELSEPLRSRLVADSSLVKFRLGQVLAEAKVLPSRVLILLEGQARVLAQADGRLITLEKLQPGAVVGLASLLRASPCEEVSAASTVVVAAAIPDHLILDIHLQGPSFRQWCQQQLWPSEIFAVMSSAWALQPQAGTTLRELFERSAAEARPISPSRESMAAVDAGHVLMLSSANVKGLAVGETLDPQGPIPRARPPLPPRLLSLPGHWLTPAAPEGASSDPAPASSTSGSAPIDDATAYPVASSLDLGQEDPSRGMRLVRGQGPLEECRACFQMLSALLKLPYRRDSIEKNLRDSMRRGQTPNLQTVGQLAAGMGLHVAGVRLPTAAFSRLQTPSMLAWGSGFALVVASNEKGMTLASPSDGMVRLGPAQIKERWPEGIDLLLLERKADSAEERFNLGWFLPVISRYRGALTQVLLASFVVQLFSLANPLLIQVIIDKVISQRSLDTLQVLGIALVVVTLLEGVLTSLRTFLFSETTNRIDMRLGAEVMDHLLRLPLSYFDKRPVGELASRMAELEKIRNFLTGQGLTTVIDSIFSVIYIVVMLLYSWLLTLIALAVIPIQVALTLLGSPLFRRQLRQGAEENARTQSHLVEVLTGIQTVKAQNVEMVSRWKWQDFYGRYISRTFEKTITGTTLNQTSQVLQKISQLLVLWVGAILVLDGQLTLGQLIAFRIISGYVTQPLLRLSTIWQSIQELKVSMERLADVVDTPQESSESDQQKIPLPPIEGNISFDDVSFGFSLADPPVLKHISFDITAGTFVGVVGQSGSGKSSMMKLLPRLYSPQQGRICIDNYNIDKVELYSLRRQIGIVPQDPLLFSGTVAQNIALTDPDAPGDSIVRAARLAAAHDFIMELPEGYSTNVGERGASLSGGQRQRIAIARTLLSNPKLLVMDEATSALDYDTEKQVCDNLRESLKNCTVFFITHRLTTIRNADRILLLHQGVIAESGTHAELMALRGRYFALFRQQEGA
ncbi:ATP-binding cassette domain-containing protein [Synechococcus sp. BSF8S]|uniref:peptidase domain-containing ABC transporter n=1 Tax=Synechococcales TaxID=1890424 RepID=UPI001629105F|nr:MULTISPECIES: peptidase domain-containing ABC transporter [unclassified Synechococcus]MBC1262257.1 ATP-binding cassette domain-containing protein [Synechococcus sp. BSF8S]MBC1265186.1 ATP-binding cassette domain-containing protein [Synechococcus sp. BSA11S]